MNNTKQASFKPCETHFVQCFSIIRKAQLGMPLFLTFTNNNASMASTQEYEETKLVNELHNQQLCSFFIDMNAHEAGQNAH